MASRRRKAAHIDDGIPDVFGPMPGSADYRRGSESSMSDWDFESNPPSPPPAGILKKQTAKPGKSISFATFDEVEHPLAQEFPRPFLKQLSKSSINWDYRDIAAGSSKSNRDESDDEELFFNVDRRVSLPVTSLPVTSLPVTSLSRQKLPQLKEVKVVINSDQAATKLVELESNDETVIPNTRRKGATTFPDYSGPAPSDNKPDGTGSSPDRTGSSPDETGSSSPDETGLTNPEKKKGLDDVDSTPEEREQLLKDEPTEANNKGLANRDQNGEPAHRNQVLPTSPSGLVVQLRETSGDDKEKMDGFKKANSGLGFKSTVDKVVEGMKLSNLRKQTEAKKLNLVVTFFFLTVAFLVGAAHVVYYKHIGEIRLFDKLRLEEAHRRMLLYSETDELIIVSRLGVSFPPEVHPYPCIEPDNLHHNEDSGAGGRCLEWKDLARLTLQHVEVDHKTHCYNLFWQSLNENVSPMDCFPVSDLKDERKKKKKSKGNKVKRSLEHSENQGHWYGGGESLRAAWPLERGMIKLSPFVTGDEGRTEWGNLIKKYFLNSRGLSLTIDDLTPLFVSLNDPEDSGLCIQAKFDNFAYYYHRFDYPKLNYTVCTDKSIVKLHRQFLPKSFWAGHTQQDLDRLHHLLKKEIWQVPFDSDLSHEVLVNYINEVKSLDLEEAPGSAGLKRDRGYLMLTYRWQKNMGDFRFSKEAFPNLTQTMEYIREAGLTLVLTVNPFISTDSVNFQSAVRESLFVKERNSTKHNVPALTWFKDVASAALLDITNEATGDWLRAQMRRLEEELGTDTVFYVDSGNTFHTPTYFEFKVPMHNPDLYRDHFVQNIMQEVPVIGVSSAASKRPRAPAFVFMTPTESDWLYLGSIVSNMLQLSVIDYPFINPGPVGGIPGNYSDDEGNAEEDFELYLRWWQLNTFMPMMHFIKPPSAFPSEKVKPIFKKLKQLRETVVLPRLVRFSNEAVRESTPIIRPLWMMESSNEDAQQIDDQFLIGDEILVAPILNKGQRSRDVYLPRIEGRDGPVVWKRGSDGRFYMGGEWSRNIKVGLEEVLYFTRHTGGSLPGLGEDP